MQKNVKKHLQHYWP